MKSVIRQAALRIFVAAALVAGGPVAQAASINLSSSVGPDPDITTFNGALNYTYVGVCYNSGSSGATVACAANSTKTHAWNLSYGKLTYTYGTSGSSMTLKATQTSTPVAVTGTYVAGSGATTSASQNYNLSVIFGFNSSGVATSILASDPWTGDAVYSSSLAVKGKTTVAGFTSGTLVTGTPTNATLPPYNKLYNFGYAGTNKAGIFEFVFNNIGGDFRAKSTNQGGIIISTFNLCRGTYSVPGNNTGTCSVAPPTTSWDAQGANFWKSNFTAQANADTFVPVPAAVWLFGSALAGLTVARRRKTVSLA